MKIIWIKTGLKNIRKIKPLIEKTSHSKRGKLLKVTVKYFMNTKYVGNIKIYKYFFFSFTSITSFLFQATINTFLYCYCKKHDYTTHETISKNIYTLLLIRSKFPSDLKYNHLNTDSTL